MNHFPPLSLLGANAISVRTLALAFWLQEIVDETIHGNWDPHVKVRCYLEGTHLYLATVRLPSG